MRSMGRWLYSLSATAVILLVSLPLRADPPERVGRLNLIDGTVSFRPADLDQWATAQQNYPLTTGDHLWTGDNSRAEVHVGSTAIRLAPQTAFEFLNLDDQTVQIRLTQGDVDLRVRVLGPNEAYEVDTPNVAISLLRTGMEDYTRPTKPRISGRPTQKSPMTCASSICSATPRPTSHWTTAGVRSKWRFRIIRMWSCAPEKATTPQGPSRSRLPEATRVRQPGRLKPLPGHLTGIE